MATFERRPLGEVLAERGYVRGPFGSALRRPELQEQGIPVYEQGHAIEESRQFRYYISPEKFEELSRFQVRTDDLIISCSGTVGRISIIQPDDPKGIISQALLILRPDTSAILPRFLYYFLCTREGQHALSQASHGSVQVNIAPRAVVEQIDVPVPALPVQRRIIRILGTLDDKIELNRRMNRTLEAIARAIFKSWFVDFDPVHAKAEGREPVGMAPEIAALFPDSFHDSPLGKIPKGWDVSTVGKEFELTMGQSPPGSTYNEDGGGLPFFQGRRDFGFRFPTQRVFCTAPKRIAEEGDTLVSVRAPVGDVNMAPVQLCLGRGLAGVRHNSGSRSYTYYSMLSLRERFREYESEGTVFGAINKSQFAGLDWITPPADLVKTFDNRLYAVDESIRLNEAESRHLASVRDMLLPRLLSGGTRLAAQENVDAND